MNQNIALNIEADPIAADIDGTELHDEAYNDGAFYAETDWQHCRKRPGFLWGPNSMAEHCAVVWAEVAANICPEWNNEHARLAFFIGYEDRATELAYAGEAGYEALVEAGTLADTEGWVLQCEPWAAKATDSEKALRAVRAAWAGAARWQAVAEASGEQSDAIQALDAVIRAEAAGELLLHSGYVAGALTHAH
ncbi:hypothetical protein [Paraburkholderia sp. BL27I4N3]|uniref:hypothetical protein n=1 Tax=Paraburkholderia sp. BL27I4N3 TaxID=1938805 RepID=UPI000E23B016|nr:hypothetical protein [Paraburkholderia sp. BL27I4N3]